MYGDLYPYVCVADKCDDATEIYSSSKEWLAHIRTRHLMRWHCVSGSHPTPVVLENESEFIDHMRLSHPGKFPDNQLPFIAESSSRPKEPTFDHCPFCVDSPADLVDHIVQHLRILALSSLPWPDDSGGTSQGKSNHFSTSSVDAATRETLRIPDNENDSWEYESLSTEDNIPDLVLRDNPSRNIRLSTYRHIPFINRQHSPVNIVDQLSDKLLVKMAKQKYAEKAKDFEYWHLMNVGDMTLDLEKFAGSFKSTLANTNTVTPPLELMIEMAMLSHPTGQRPEFIPVSVLQQMMNYETVKDFLEQCGEDFDEAIPELARFFSNRAFKVFAILVRHRQLSLVNRFYQSLIDDSMLPIYKQYRIVEGKTDWRIESYNNSFNYDAVLSNVFHVGDPWDKQIDEFCESWQWPFVPPVFVRTRFRYKFPDKVRLPFTGIRRIKPWVSNPGSVVKESVHIDHVPNDPVRKLNPNWCRKMR